MATEEKIRKVYLALNLYKNFLIEKRLRKKKYRENEDDNIGEDPENHEIMQEEIENVNPEFEEPKPEKKRKLVRLKERNLYDETPDENGNDEPRNEKKLEEKPEEKEDKNEDITEENVL